MRSCYKSSSRCSPKYLKKLGLKVDEIETMWDEIKRAVRSDSQEEFDELMENPEELVDRLVRILASFMAPMALKLVRASRCSDEPVLKRTTDLQPASGLKWTLTQAIGSQRGRCKGREGCAQSEWVLSEAG